MDKPTTCSICGGELGRDWLMLPTGGISHANCAVDMLTQRPDRARSLEAWQRVSGRKLGAGAVRSWLAARLGAAARQLFVAPGRRGLIVKAGQVVLELVPARAGAVIAFVHGRQLVVTSGADVVELLRSAEHVEARARHPEQPAA